MTNHYIPNLIQLAEDSAPWAMFGGQQVLSEVADILVSDQPELQYTDTRTSEAERILENELSAYFAGNGNSPTETIRAAADAIRAIQ